MEGGAAAGGLTRAASRSAIQALQRLHGLQMRVIVLEPDTMAAGTGCDDQIRRWHRDALGPGRASQFVGSRPHRVVDRKTRQRCRHLCHDTPFWFASSAVPQFELDEGAPRSFTGFQQRPYAGCHSAIAVGPKTVNPRGRVDEGQRGSVRRP